MVQIIVEVTKNLLDKEVKNYTTTENDRTLKSKFYAIPDWFLTDASKVFKDKEWESSFDKAIRPKIKEYQGKLETAEKLKVTFEAPIQGGGKKQIIMKW